MIFDPATIRMLAVLHSIALSGSIVPYSRAANATNGFIVDPGEYKLDIDLFTSGFNGLSLIISHSLYQYHE